MTYLSRLKTYAVKLRSSMYLVLKLIAGKNKIFATRVSTYLTRGQSRAPLRSLVKKIFIPTLAIALFLFVITKADALTMVNGIYIIDAGNLNSVAGTSTGGNNKLDITVGEKGGGFSNGPNYKIRAGFEFMHNTVTFAFTIQGSKIDFGSLIAGTPVTRTNNIVISNGSAYGYAVTAQESTALRDPSNGKFIPDTTCDDGLCTPTNASIWNTPTTYCFWYHCSNITRIDYASRFTNSTYDKECSASPSATTVMSSTNVGKNRTIQITYKVNIAPTQEAGLYGNYIMFIATPKF